MKYGIKKSFMQNIKKGNATRTQKKINKKPQLN